jgi:hypothetical protein
MEIRTPFDWWGVSHARVKSEALKPAPKQSFGNPSLTASYIFDFRIRRLSRRSLGKGGFDWWGVLGARVKTEARAMLSSANLVA